MQISVGDRVVAQNRITEVGFKREGRRHLHARPGDTGQVLLIEHPEIVTVAFERSTATCHASELNHRAPVVPSAETVQRIN